MVPPPWRADFKRTTKDHKKKIRTYIPNSAEPGKVIPVTEYEDVTVTSPSDKERQEYWRSIITKAKATNKVVHELKAAVYYRLGVCEWVPKAGEFLFSREVWEENATVLSTIDMPLERYGKRRFLQAVMSPSGSFALLVNRFPIEKVITPFAVVDITLKNPFSIRRRGTLLQKDFYLEWNGPDALLKVCIDKLTYTTPLERIMAIKYNFEVRTILFQIRRSGLKDPDEVLVRLRSITADYWMELQTSCYHLIKGDEHFRKCDRVSAESLNRKMEDMT